MGRSRQFRKQCYRHIPCLVQIEVRDENGNFDIGTGFHIGGGYIVTAAHVARKGNVKVLAHPFIASADREGETAFSDAADGEHETWLETTELNVARALYPADDSVDLALLETDFDSGFFMSDKLVDDRKKVDHFRLKDFWDEHFWEDEVLTSDVLILGYPRIPLSSKSYLVTTKANIISVVGKMSKEHTFLVLSSMARGGFSGAPVINSKGRVIAICIESLNHQELVEAGFTTAITVEALNRLLVEQQVYPGRNAKIVKRVKEGLGFVSSQREASQHRQTIL